MDADRPLHRDEAESIIDATSRGSIELSDEANRRDRDARWSDQPTPPPAPCGQPHLLRPGHGRSPESRILGDFEEVLNIPVPRDPLATRFYEAVCLISDPDRSIPGRTVSLQMLNSMRRLSDERRMEAEQVTAFAEVMAERVQEARTRG